MSLLKLIMPLFVCMHMLGAVKFYEEVQAPYLLVLLEKLEHGENIIFTKIGDGEYYCTLGMGGKNCDADTYTSWLGESLKKALVNLSKKKNAYIGKWGHAYIPEYCDRIAAMHGVAVPWVWFGLIMNVDGFLDYDYMYKFVRFIVTTNRKKIVMANSMNKKMKDLFRADVYIEIPAQNWSFEYNKWKSLLEQHVEKDAIVLISGGMCSKVLADDITNDYDLTFVDVGSTFDLLCRKQGTRGWAHSYEDELKYYGDLLPQNWEQL